MPPQENSPAPPASHDAATDAPVVLVAAVASNGVIGAGNGLPWRLADDLRRFKALTMGHAVIMGRRTWETLPRALPGRQNIVVTRQHGYAAAGAETASTFDEALARVRLPGPAFCIGGGEIYREALPRATRLDLTEIARDFEGDTRFPPLPAGQWRETAREAHRSDGLDYAYVTYVRAAAAA
jgi:dihydrofolate reductase